MPRCVKSFAVTANAGAQQLDDVTLLPHQNDDFSTQPFTRDATTRRAHALIRHWSAPEPTRPVFAAVGTLLECHLIIMAFLLDLRLAVMQRHLTVAFALVAVTCAGTVHAQDAAPYEPPRKSRFSRLQSTLFVEAGGPGGYYSVNYGFRMGSRDAGLSLTAGASLADAVRFPFGWSAVIGREDAFEIGFNYTLASEEESTIGALIGYRYQPEGEDLFARVALTPTIPLEPQFMSFWISASAALGWTF